MVNFPSLCSLKFRRLHTNEFIKEEVDGWRRKISYFHHE